MDITTLLIANSIFLSFTTIILLISLFIVVKKERRKEKETINKIKKQISED